MRNRKFSLLFAGVCVMFLLGSCGNTGQMDGNTAYMEGLDNLNNIQVISREEGSGTRNTFAELVGFSNNDEKKPDLTTDTAEIVNNAEEVCEKVSKNKSAIGYLSLGALPENESIKVLSVNGIKASLEEKTYPLSRTFYLAYSGKLSDLEQEFLTYVHGAGQEIVSESYIPVAKSSTFLSGKAKGTIKIGGSTSVAPLIEKLASAYMEINPNARIIIETSDSGTGLTKAMSEELDFGMSSRDLRDYEKQLLDYEAIAEDEIAVVVNTENPLENITMDDLKSIFTGDFAKWEDINHK